MRGLHVALGALANVIQLGTRPEHFVTEAIGLGAQALDFGFQWQAGVFGGCSLGRIRFLMVSHSVLQSRYAGGTIATAFESGGDGSLGKG